MPGRNERRFKTLLLGDQQTGKTTFLRKLVTGNFYPNFNPSKEVERAMIKFYTRTEVLKFDIVNIPGIQYEVGGNFLNQYEDIDCALIMYNARSRITYAKIPNYARDLRRLFGPIALAAVGAKGDTEKARSWKVSTKVPHVCTSSLMDVNCVTPFQLLADQLVDGIGQLQISPKDTPLIGYSSRGNVVYEMSVR